MFPTEIQIEKEQSYKVIKIRLRRFFKRLLYHDSSSSFFFHKVLLATKNNCQDRQDLKLKKGDAPRKNHVKIQVFKGMVKQGFRTPAAARNCRAGGGMVDRNSFSRESRDGSSCCQSERKSQPRTIRHLSRIAK